MWLTFAMIFLAVAMVVGPVMMVRPTPGTVKLARLRSLASQESMNVRMPPKSTRKRGAIYSIPLSPIMRERKPLTEWKLEKKSHEHALHFRGQWDWEGDDRPEKAVCDDLETFLGTVPDGLTSFDCNAIGVGCLWDEYCRGKDEKTALFEVKNTLLRLRKLLE